MTDENAPGGEAVTDEAAQAAAAAEAQPSETPPEAPAEPAPEPTPEEKAAQEAEAARQKQAAKTQKRIASEHGRRKQAEAAQHKAELEAAELRGRLSVQQEAQPAAEPPVAGGREEYVDDDAWMAAHNARAIFEAKQTFEADAAERARLAGIQATQDTAAEQARALQQKFSEREVEARAKFVDYDEVVDNPDAMWNDHMRETAIRLPNGPEIAYHLGQNPDEATRIAQLDPRVADAELGAIGARLAQAGAKPSPKLTSAPDPINPVGSGTETPTKSPDNMTNEEYRQSRGFDARLKRG